MTSKRKTGKDLGVDRATIQRWASHPDWPWGADPKRWPALPEIRRWREEHLSAGRGRGAMTMAPSESGGTSAATVRALEAKYKLEQGKLLQLKREILEGQYVEASRYERAIFGLIEQYRHHWEEAIRRLPAICAGMDGPGIEHEMRDQFNVSLERLIQEGLRLATADEVAAMKAGNGKNPAKVGAANARHARS